MTRQQRGLTTVIKKSSNRCKRCDILLEYSVWNNVNLVYLANQKCHDYLCLDCATRKTDSSTKPRVTVAEIETYINKTFRKLK